MKNAFRLHFVRRPLLIAAVLGLAGLVTSCCHTCPAPAEPAFDAADVAAATRIIDAGGTWDATRAAQLKALYIRLPGNQRFEVLRQLASAVNSKKIIVPPGQLPLLSGHDVRPGSTCNLRPALCQPASAGAAKQTK
jgi:hypothetical protein